MRKLLTSAIFSAAVLAGGSAFAGQVSVGIQIGAPPAPRVVRVAPRPGPDFAWVDGYWYPVRGRYYWREGYWTRPPYAGARWIGPRYDGRRYFEGYWQRNERFDRDHDRRGDRDHDRDRRDRDRDGRWDRRR